jgi:hypothetical protein
MAVMRARASEDTATHHSALALHGLPLWAVDRGLVVLMADVEEAITRGDLRLMPLCALVSTEDVDPLRAALALVAA